MAVDAAEKSFGEPIGAERQEPAGGDAEQQAAMRLALDREQRAGKAARLMRVGVERRDQEEQADDRDDGGARQVAGAPERGHEGARLLAQRDAMAKLAANARDRDAGAADDDRDADQADRNVAKSMGEQ